MRYFEAVTKRIKDQADETVEGKGPEDRRDFEKINAVVMGRRSWESIPAKYQPLKQRLNVVLSKKWKREENADADKEKAESIPKTPTIPSPLPYVLYNSFPNAIDALANDPKVSRIYIIGGSHIYAEAIKSPLCARILLTRVYKEFECDTFFPPIDEEVYVRTTHNELVEFVGEDVPEGVQVENGIEYEFMMFRRRKVIDES